MTNPAPPSYPQLPIIECTACGRQLGHMYDTYYDHVQKLKVVHNDLLTGALSVDSVNDTEYTVKDLNDRNYWTFFYKVYYLWMQRPEHAEFRDMYAVEAIVAQALLAWRELTNEDLDYEDPEKGKIPLNPSGSDAARYCCLKNFYVDNSRVNY